jgi:hypothetical protein
MSVRTLRATIFCAALGACALSPALALAQDDPKLGKALRGAVEDYDMLMLDDAEAKLNEAIGYASKNNLSGPNVAKLYVMLGIVIFARDRDEAKTEAAFISALEQDKAAKIDAVYETPDITKIFERARKKAKPPKDNPPPDRHNTNTTNNNTNANSPADVKGFEHKPLLKAPAGKPLMVEVLVARDMPVFNVTIYHRRFGEVDFSKTDLKPTDATRFAGEIPAAQVRTSQLEYYIEATDRGGQILATFASARKPHMVLLTGSDELPDDNNKNNNKDKNNNGGKVEPPAVSSKNVYVSLGGGSAVGLLTGGKPTANPQSNVDPGLAPAFGHAVLDLGWLINESMRLGLFLRWQFSPTQNFSVLPPEASAGGFPSGKAECFGFGLPGECILGLKYRYFFTKGPGTRFYSSVGMGVGRVRHWLQVPVVYESQGVLNPACNGKEILITPAGVRYCNMRDTVRTGWGHFGVGAGTTVPIGDTVEFYADGYLMFLALDQTSITLDATLGFNFKF